MEKKNIIIFDDIIVGALFNNILINGIVPYLDPKSIMQLTSTCKLLYKLRNDQYWEIMCNGKKIKCYFKDEKDFHRYYPEITFTWYKNWMMINLFLDKPIKTCDFTLNDNRNSGIIGKFPMMCKLFNLKYSCADLYCYVRKNAGEIFTFKNSDAKYIDLYQQYGSESTIKFSFFCELDDHTIFKFIHSEEVKYNSNVIESKLIDTIVPADVFLKQASSVKIRKGNPIPENVRVFSFFNDSVYYSSLNKNIGTVMNDLNLIIGAYT